MKLESTEKKVKFIGTIVGIILFVLLMAGITYAWITWNSSNIDIAGNTECFTIDYTKGKNISNESVILFDESKIINNNKITIKNGMAITNVTANINSNCTIPGDITISMTASNINNAFISGNSVGAFKYALVRYNPNQYTNITTSALEGISFDIIKNESITSTNKIELGTDELSYAKKGYMIIFYIDGDLASNDAANTTFSASIDAVVTQIQGELTKPVNLISHINDLYNNTSKTTVTNNSIEYNYASIYDQDDDDTTSGGLMNDRLGGTTSNYDDGNIRYYGANPLNYIDIGDVYTTNVTIDNFEKNKLFLGMMGVTDRASCYTMMDCETNYEAFEFPDSATCQAFLGITDTEELCGTEEKKAGDPKLYRIIGLFKDIEKTDGTTEDLVKIIREESIGEFAWDLVSDDSGYAYANDWSNSTLKSILNNEYFNSQSINHAYWDVLTGEEGTFTTDLTKKGLNSSVHNKIESVKWNLGGWNTSEIYADQIYGYERGNAKCSDCTYETIWPGKIALMYPSDYGYAADFTQCEDTLNNYSNSCLMYDWMYSLSKGNMFEWLLTPGSDDSAGAWRVNGGLVHDNDGVRNGVGVRPSMFLKSNMFILSGDGSKDNPYKV